MSEGSEPLSRRRLESGDSLRALAAIGILTNHVGLEIYAYFAKGGRDPDVFGPAVGYALRFLGSGLWIFFPLSGYVVARPFVRAFVDGRAMPSVSRFLRNRALRILPALWVVLAVVLLRWGASGASFRQLLGAFTLTTGYANHPLAFYIGQAWNLQMEGVFYVATPAVCFLLIAFCGSRLGRTGRLRLMTGIALCLAAVGLVLGGAAGAHPRRGHNLLVVAVAFVPGLLLACFEQRSRPRWSWSARQRRWMAAGMFWGGVSVLVLRSMLSVPSGRTIGLAALGGGAVLAGAAARERIDDYGWAWLRLRVLHWIGARSYGIYLIHIAVIFELTPWLVPGSSPQRAFAFLLAGSFMASLVLADLSWRAVEQPFLRLRQPAAPAAPQTVSASQDQPGPGARGLVLPRGPVQ